MGRPAIDETGNRYGKLVVISGAGFTKKGAKRWKCVCDCGNHKITVGQKLRDGDVQSCGCYKHVYKLGVYSKDEIGNIYGHLTVISRADNKRRLCKDGSIKVESNWRCQCRCGNFVEVRGRSLRYGNVRSCGCGGHGPTDVAFNNLYVRLVGSARARGYPWKLSKEIVKGITSKPCTYCGTVPNQVSKSKGGHPYIYNGIDRVDNSKGYVRGNVVPCCKICNGAKLSSSLEDFKSWIYKAYHHLISSNIHD